MGMITEFKQFALKGNMIDMAVGIVIGGAFTSLINSLVRDVMTPPLGLLTEKVSFDEMAIPLRSGTVAADGTETGAVAINVGAFINACISFLIVAAALFLVIKAMNRVRQQFEATDETPSPTTKTCPECRMEIPINATRCGHCTSALAA